MRKQYFDILNIISCVSVIALHQNGIVHQYADTTNWKSALVVEIVFYFAVPVFFMLSGATLLDYRNRYSTRDFFIKRFNRVFIPFIFWSLFWAAIHYFYFKTAIPTPLHLINGIIHTQYQGVYWFFIPLFGVYLLMPVLSCLTEHKRILLYLTTLIFICDGILLPITRIFAISPIGIIENGISGPVMFVLFGYLISKNYLLKGTQRYSKVLLYVLAFVCLVLRYYVTYRLSTINNELYRGLFNYYYFTSAIPAIAVFLIVKNLSSRINISETTSQIISKISSCSFGIYLIHKLIMMIELKGLGILGITPDNWIYRILFIPITYFVCLIIVHISKRTKIGKIIFP